MLLIRHSGAAVEVARARHVYVHVHGRMCIAAHLCLYISSPARRCVRFLPHRPPFSSSCVVSSRVCAAYPPVPRPHLPLCRCSVTRCTTAAMNRNSNSNSNSNNSHNNTHAIKRETHSNSESKHDAEMTAQEEEDDPMPYHKPALARRASDTSTSGSTSSSSASHDMSHHTYQRGCTVLSNKLWRACQQQLRRAKQGMQQLKSKMDEIK